MTNIIHPSFKHGKDFKIGNFCIIEEGVEIGDGVELQNYVLLKKGTKIGNNVYIDSYVRSSGINKIGNNVTLRFGCTVAREVTVEDNVFISPNVMTIYSAPDGTKMPGTIIGEGTFVGTAAILNGGITIGKNVIIAAGAYIRKNCREGETYAGSPAKRLR